MDKGEGGVGIGLIILGNILYLAFIFLKSSGSSAFGDFATGLLLGVSIGINLIGIILVVAYISKEKK